MRQMYKQDTERETDYVDPVPTGAPLSNKRLMFNWFIFGLFWLLSMIFTRLGRAATGLPELLIAPLAAMSALSVVFFLYKWLLPRKKA